MQGDCVFCAIVRGQADASVVHADATVLAFLDLHPVTPGHLLVVPTAHAAGLEDLDIATGARMWTVAHRLGRALRRSGLRCEGVNLWLADGEAASQDVFHVHLHVIPRFAGDGFRLDGEGLTCGRSELDAAAAAVREGLAHGPAEEETGP